MLHPVAVTPAFVSDSYSEVPKFRISKNKASVTPFNMQCSTPRLRTSQCTSQPLWADSTAKIRNSLERNALYGEKKKKTLNKEGNIRQPKGIIRQPKGIKSQTKGLREQSKGLRDRQDGGVIRSFHGRFLEMFSKKMPTLTFFHETVCGTNH